MSTLYTRSFHVVVIVLLFYVTTLSQNSNERKGDIDSRLGGRWKATLKESDGVEIDFWMTFETTRAGNAYAWEAYSRSGAAREIIGGGTAFLGSLLGKLPPREALVFIGDGTVEERADALQLKGALKSPFLGNRDFIGSLSEGKIRAELKRATSSNAAGTLEFVRDDSQTALRDYQKIGRETENIIRRTIYDPKLLERADFVKFFDELSRRFSTARDDLDAITSFQASKRFLQSSHFDFIRNPTLASKSIEEIIIGSSGIKKPDSLVTLSFPVPQVAFLRVSKWDRVADAVDKAFERIDTAKPRVLILDIRSNSGGDATSMSPLAHLLQKPVSVGAFLGRKWYERNPLPPAPTEMTNLDQMTSDKPPVDFFKQLQERGAVVGKTVTKEPYFDGTVYLLTDKGTASASEPLAYLLKTSKRATLVGERTAGAMLTALPHTVGDGWLVTVPEADFVTADGVRLEGKCVEPDIKIASNDVFLEVANQIEKSLPFSAAALRGGSYESMKRLEEAEKAYRKSLSLSDSQNPKPNAKTLASVHKRLAAILQSRGDAQGAKREYEAVLRLVPDDAEALAALRSATNSEK